MYEMPARWEGRDAVMARLRRLVPNAEKNAAQAQLEVARDLARAIQARAPRRTGAYAKSIQGDRLSSRPSQTLVGSRPTKDPNATGIFAKFIWKFLEFGTRHSRAQPHIFPTYRALRRSIRSKIARAINKAVREVAG